jgi:hypothetical protein
MPKKEELCACQHFCKYCKTRIGININGDWIDKTGGDCCSYNTENSVHKPMEQ